jgi:phosphoserine phosphatase
VIFDCDSTLCAIEGIETISRGNEEVERLTTAAMNGEVSLEAVYGLRLEQVRPGAAALERLGHQYIEALVPVAREVVRALHREAIRVRIMSGGLWPAVIAVGRELGLADEDIAAVRVDFDETGNYAGFDAASALARSGGKLELVRAWRAILPAPIMLVGDGATDAEAVPELDVFVAYCGIAERPSVVAVADHVIVGASLAPVLPIALGGRSPDDRALIPLFEKGMSLLAPENRQ